MVLGIDRWPWLQPTKKRSINKKEKHWWEKKKGKFTYINIRRVETTEIPEPELNEKVVERKSIHFPSLRYFSSLYQSFLYHFGCRTWRDACTFNMRSQYIQYMGWTVTDIVLFVSPSTLYYFILLQIRRTILWVQVQQWCYAIPAKCRMPNVECRMPQHFYSCRSDISYVEVRIDDNHAIRLDFAYAMRWKVTTWRVCYSPSNMFEIVSVNYETPRIDWMIPSKNISYHHQTPTSLFFHFSTLCCWCRFSSTIRRSDSVGLLLSPAYGFYIISE